jgi:co-chaperonin GroES (HSP10)
MNQDQKRQEWREARLKELQNLPIDESFSIPAGLIIPFGDNILLKEVMQGEIKSKSGIITKVPASKTIGASVGLVMGIGEEVTIPVHLGMKVYYEPTTMLRVYHNGDEYIQMSQHLIFGAVPPETYLEAYVPDSIALRRESRQTNMAKVDAQEEEILKESIETNTPVEIIKNRQ